MRAEQRVRPPPRRFRPEAARTSRVAGTLSPLSARMKWSFGDGEGHEAGEDARRQRVTEGLRERVTAAIRARLGQAASAGGEHDARRAHRRPGRRREHEAAPHRASTPRRARDGAPPRLRERAAASSASSTVRARSVTGKSLPVSSRLSSTPCSRKKRDRARHVEAAQDLADGRGRRAVEVALVHGVMGDVAPPAAGHEDLRPQHARAVERATTRRSGAERAAQIAAMSPAAPAPTTTRSASGPPPSRKRRRRRLSRPRRSPARARGRRPACPCARCGRWRPPCSGAASGAVARMRSRRRPSFLGKESIR